MLGLIVFIVVLVFGGGSAARVGTPMPNEGATHVDQTTVPTYQSRPATSGPHWNLGDGVAPVFWGVYTTPVAEPAVVHNLEHGGIVIWYQNTATPDDIQQLTQFVEQAQAGSNFKILLSPWAGDDFGQRAEGDSQLVSMSGRQAQIAFACRQVKQADIGEAGVEGFA